MTHAHAPHEEAEHASHASHEGFDKRVALTVVVVAAVLAGVKVLGHRAHNDTLLHQIEAGVHHTRETDQWNFYQAKKLRQHIYEAEAPLLRQLSREQVLARHSTACEAAGATALFTAPEVQQEYIWTAQAARYETETKGIRKEAEVLQKEAEKAQEKSHAAHHKSNFYDLGELGVELALILCSVAILTKRSSFWYAGIAIGLVGLGVALFGLVGPLGGSHGQDHHPPATQAVPPRTDIQHVGSHSSDH